MPLLSSACRRLRDRHGSPMTVTILPYYIYIYISTMPPTHTTHPIHQLTLHTLLTLFFYSHL